MQASFLSGGGGGVEEMVYKMKSLERRKIRLSNVSLNISLAMNDESVTPFPHLPHRHYLCRTFNRIRILSPHH